MTPAPQTDAQKWRIIGILCTCSFSNAYLGISIFPYGGYMVQFFGVSPEETAIYAGLLGTCFMGGRLVTAYFVWGHMADTYGRVFTLQTALIGSSVCSLLFGLATSLPVAIFWRTMLGAFNGIMSNTKTIASELHSGIWEVRTMGLVIGMRSWALLFGPVAGGLLAEPLHQYSTWTQELEVKGNWIYRMMSRFPFLLPNVLGSVLCLIAAALLFQVPETLPQPESPISAINKIFCCYSRRTLDGNGRDSQIRPPTEESRLLPLSAERTVSESQTAWQVPLARQHMLLIWTFSMVASYIDEALPLYCMLFLSMTEVDIGKVLSIAGVIFASLQYLFFSSLTHRVGRHNAIWMGALFGSLPAVALGLAGLKFDGTLLLASVLALLKLFHSTFFSNMAMSVNKTVESDRRAKLNALITTGNSLGRGLGPSLAGGVITLSLYWTHSNIEWASVLIWGPVPLVCGLMVSWKSSQLRQDSS